MQFLFNFTLSNLAWILIIYILIYYLIFNESTLVLHLLRNLIIELNVLRVVNGINKVWLIIEINLVNRRRYLIFEIFDIKNIVLLVYVDLLNWCIYLIIDHWIIFIICLRIIKSLKHILLLLHHILLIYYIVAHVLNVILVLIILFQFLIILF